MLRFFLQAEDGIRELVRARGLGDVYKRQVQAFQRQSARLLPIPRRSRSPTRGSEYTRYPAPHPVGQGRFPKAPPAWCGGCLLYTSDAADELLFVDLGSRRIIKKKIL